MVALNEILILHIYINNIIMKPTLVILAAGMASRYGSMKQIQAFGPSAETIMDYSIYDAIRAGFGKVVFIIREEFAENFKNTFDSKLSGKIETAYVYQQLDSYVKIPLSISRSKPWGTGHALLCCKDLIKEPFAVINADDFYGSDGFQKAAEFLRTEVSAKLFAIIGYELGKTLSANGSVSRGVCTIDPDGNLGGITERTRIYRGDKNEIYYEDETGVHPEMDNSTVSMNFFAFHPSVFSLAEKLFDDFLKTHGSDPKSEFFIPTVVDRFVGKGKGKVRVVHTDASWFGVTYKEDAVFVQQSIHELIRRGIYPEALWA